MDLRVGIKNGKIQAVIGNADMRDTAAEEAEHAGTVFQTLSGEDVNSWDARKLNEGWDWDDTNKVGVEPAADQTSRLAEESELSDAQGVKAAVGEIAAGTYAGTDTQAIQDLAKAMRFLMRNL
jgi:hypothetical protein